MAAYSSLQSVATATYPATPQVEIPFYQPKRVRAENFDAAAVVYVSFDGVNDHGALLDDVLSPSSTHEWTWQVSQKVWLRTAAGVATQVQIIAEG